MARLTEAEARQIIDTARACAEAARAETLAHFRTAMSGDETKSATAYDPVTEADRAAERAMRAILANERPNDAIMGEEYGRETGISGLTWVLDPIDGTRGFLAGTPTWGVLISVADAGGPLFGIIDQPYIGERFEGGLGLARLLGPHGESRLATRAPRPLSEATLFSTFPEVGSPAEARAFHAVAGAARLTRYGMDCYAYGLVALGQADLVIEAGLQAYDIHAPVAVIEAAGGIVTDWQGEPAQDGGQVIAAANAAIHAEALERLQAALDD
ncbi:inositol monophosphatase family protein [Histidinibacterium lentulum]|uniref:Histidinol-phosphatase n=1 Tax=Histidinibacterium lentulum TaxID=2480588 RepID=A0A3N2QY86_9RHOB|nr:inositol monophosphatase family protein [Histidinibacterium lentulum]ROU00184.1 histidinol-phosphatase [Histidinibacterium lentulum]